MQPRKRYTARQAEALLTRLVTVAKAPPVAARRVLSELTTAWLGDTVIAGSALETVRTASPEAVAAWSQRVETLLRGIVNVGEHLPGVRQVMMLKPVTLMISPTTLRQEASVSPGHALTMQTVALVRVVGLERLRRCDCDQLFVKVGKRKACSEQCQKRVYMRRYRAGEAGKD